MNLYWQFEPVRVGFHLDHGYTRVIFERLVGPGMLDGNWFEDIPTASISPNLRRMGSRFLLSWQSFYEPGNSENIRATYCVPIVRLE